MTGADAAFFSLLLDAFKHNWHYGFMVAGVILLIYGVKSRKGISIQLGGNGNGQHAPAEKLVSYTRFQEFRETMNSRLDHHDEETKEIREELRGMRSDIKSVSESAARIEGILSKK